ncbi:uncharacterized protein LOC144108009 [Amblyomma americanum]
MCGTEYTLTGFDDFLERRRVVFVKPLPSTRVCSLCAMVPSNSLLLPCGHVVCPFCKSQIAKEGGKCPMDDVEFEEADVVSMSFKQSDLEQRCVRCVAGGQKCSFTGKLSELKDHLLECGSDEVRCAKCERSFSRSSAAEHCQLCPANACKCPRQPLSVAAIASAVEGLSGIRRDLEKIQEQAPSKKDGPEAAANTASSLVERIASLERQLVVVQEKSSEDQCDSISSALTKAAFTPGPQRSASKRGNFIVTCKFSDVFKGNEVLNGTSNYHTVSSDTCTLAGYTFKLQCRFEYSKIYFTFHLCEGGWDVCVEWPFCKKVMLILTHPTCMAKDIKLPVRIENTEMAKKPLLGNANMGAPTDTIVFADIQRLGFVIDKALYVNVEIE